MLYCVWCWVVLWAWMRRLHGRHMSNVHSTQCTPAMILSVRHISHTYALAGTHAWCACTCRIIVTRSSRSFCPSFVRWWNSAGAECDRNMHSAQ